MRKSKTSLRLLSIFLALVMVFGTLISMPVLGEEYIKGDYAGLKDYNLELGYYPEVISPLLPEQEAGDVSFYYPDEPDNNHGFGEAYYIETIESILPMSITDELITVYITFEGYNLGHGFYIEPTRLTLPAGSSVEIPTRTLLALHNHSYEAGGLGGQNFNLNRVHNFNAGTATPPAAIMEWFTTEPWREWGMPIPWELLWDPSGRGDGSLGNGDYFMFSGWMFTINNRLLDIGAGAVILNDGDVIRWQFSLAMGDDLGAEGAWGEPLFEIVDKTQLIRTLFAEEVHPDARKAALEVIINPLATVAEVTAALELLKSGQSSQVNKTELNTAILNAENLIQGNYTPASWAVLQTALATARQVLGNTNATQVEVNEARDNLNLAIAALENINIIVPTYREAMYGALSWIRANTTDPIVGSVGGEWAVLALARAGVKDDDWYILYLANLDAALEIGNHGELTRWTDFQRVTLALTALGLDASDYNGHDLTAAFKTYIPRESRPNHSMTINADIFALIALDSRPYSGDRERYIDSILAAQGSSGGWGLAWSAEVDITAMAIQALAPYYDSNSAVRNAINHGLEWIGTQSITDVEDNAQIIVALTALGRDAQSYVEALLTFYDPVTGGFKRNGVVNAMVTEQAAYALVAYHRFVNDMNSLYDMSDAVWPGTVIIPVDKSVLNSEITKAEGRNASNYTSASWMAMQSVLAVARQVAGNANATQIEVDIAMNNLRVAINALVRISTDTTQARAFISVTDPGARAGQTRVFFAGRYLEIEPGETVYSLLRKTGLNIVASGPANNRYVVSINGFGEFSDGPNSGWMYKVNDRFYDLSASARVLSDGDRVEWVFTRDLGHDVGGGFGNAGTEADSTGVQEETTQGEGISNAVINEWINPFTDITSDDWYYQAVQFVYTQGLMNGTAPDKFSPNMNLSRAMVVTILWRLEGEPIVARGNVFSDVQSGRWYSDAIAWASERGIVRGYGNSLFGPNDNVTREQFATILYNYAKYKGLDVGDSSFIAEYADIDMISVWALDGMKWANANGLITGRTQTMLAPVGTTTRAEAATILQRFIENILSSE